MTLTELSEQTLPKAKEESNEEEVAEEVTEEGTEEEGAEEGNEEEAAEEGTEEGNEEEAAEETVTETTEEVGPGNPGNNKQVGRSGEQPNGGDWGAGDRGQNS